MTSEIEQELIENTKEIEKLIDSQNFRVKDAKKYLERYFNFVRRIQQLEISRDNWKTKHDKLKELTDSRSKAKVSSDSRENGN